MYRAAVRVEAVGNVVRQSPASVYAVMQYVYESPGYRVVRYINDLLVAAASVWRLPDDLLVTSTLAEGGFPVGCTTIRSFVKLSPPYPSFSRTYCTNTILLGWRPGGGN